MHRTSAVCWWWTRATIAGAVAGTSRGGLAVDSCALETARERACDVGLLRLRPFHLERPETVKDLISRSGTEWIAVLDATPCR